MNSRKPKQSHEQLNQSLFEELQLQLVVPDQAQQAARKAREQQAAATFSTGLPAAKGRTLH